MFKFFVSLPPEETSYWLLVKKSFLFYEKNLKSVTKNDLKEEFRQEAEELKKKLKEVIKDYNQVNNINIKINYRFDLSLDNENGKI